MNDDDQHDEASREADETSEVEPEGEEDQGEEAGVGGDVGSGAVLPIQAVSNLDSLYGLREIGKEALCWQLSSAKPGNGVEQIRDQSTDTYWQSDGVSQPHLIQVHFARRVAISHVCLYLDFNLGTLQVQGNLLFWCLCILISFSGSNTFILLENMETWDNCYENRRVSLWKGFPIALYTSFDLISISHHSC